MSKSLVDAALSDFWRSVPLTNNCRVDGWPDTSSTDSAWGAVRHFAPERLHLIQQKSYVSKCPMSINLTSADRPLALGFTEMPTGRVRAPEGQA